MVLSNEKIKLKSKIFYHFFIPIAKELEEVNYAIVKGEPLSFYAYGEFGKRYFNDIDLLIAKDSLTLVKKVLEQNGFLPLSKNRFYHAFSLGLSHQIIPYVKRIHNFSIYIDVNFSVFWGEYLGKQISMTEFLSDQISIKINECTTKTLTPLKMFIQLILHHYKDMNSIFLLATQKSIKYDMFKDLFYFFINNFDEIPLDKLYSLSKQYEITPYIYYVLYYTGVLFDSDELKKYINAFYCPDGENLLDSYGLNDEERRNWHIDFNTRLHCDNLYEFIKDDLTEKDLKKIDINKKIFLIE